jgi:hypothetical protein
MNLENHSAPTANETTAQICTRRRKNKKFLGDALEYMYQHLALGQYNSVKILLKLELEPDSRFIRRPMTDPFPEIVHEFEYPHPGPVVVRLKISNLVAGSYDPLCEWRIAHVLGSAGASKEKMSTVRTSIRRFLSAQFGGDDIYEMTKVHSISGTMILREPLGALVVLEGKSADVADSSLGIAYKSDAWQVNVNHPALFEL